MSLQFTHRRSGRLALPLLAALTLGACGSSGSSTPATSSAGTAAAPAATSSQTSATTSATAAGPRVAGVDLSQLQAKAKHLTPQQVAQIKAKLPLYLKAQAACIKQVGQEATQVLACLHQHGF